MVDHNSEIDIDQGEKDYLKLISRITYLLELEFVEPEQIIVQQNDEIYDPEKDDFIFQAFFYIIMNGSFKVTSGQFNKNKRMNAEQKLAIKNLKFSKTLKSGDYFGETAVLYKCLRTATVKSKLYATIGKITARKFLELLH